MSPTQRKAMEDARNALQRAAYTTDRPDILGLCEQADDSLRAALAEADDRKCTCHPDDNPPQPCPKQFALGECRQATALNEADEPIAWQYRTRPTWGSRHGLEERPWSPWEFCSKEVAEDCWRTPFLNDWAYEARALYTHPPRREPLTALTKGATWEQQK